MFPEERDPAEWLIYCRLVLCYESEKADERCFAIAGHKESAS